MTRNTMYGNKIIIFHNILLKIILTMKASIWIVTEIKVLMQIFYCRLGLKPTELILNLSSFLAAS